MPLRRVTICLILFSTAFISARSDDSESRQLIQGGVTKARMKFDLAEERLTKALLDDFDSAIASARSKGDNEPANANRIQQLKKARDQFSASGILPLPEVLSKPVDTFEASLNQAREEAEQAFDMAISVTSKMKQDAFTNELTAQKKNFLVSFAKRHPPRIVSRWVHVVGRNDRYRFDFASDGRIIAPDGDFRSWQISGRTLTIKSPAAKAPGGFWIDRCRLSPDGNSYVGRNQDKTEILGKRLPAE